MNLLVAEPAMSHAAIPSVNWAIYTVPHHHFFVTSKLELLLSHSSYLDFLQEWSAVGGGSGNHPRRLLQLLLSVHTRVQGLACLQASHGACP